jgi:alanine racemase
MWQAEVRVDLGAIRTNVALLCQGTSAQVMAVVKGDGYGHGLVQSARAAVAGGATWLGACTLGEALTLRRAGISERIFAWLLVPGLPLHEAIEADIDLSASSLGLLSEIVAAARRAQDATVARVHLKVDTGLARGGATARDWPLLCEAAAKAQADGDIEVVGVWSHLVYADVPDHETTDQQLATFRESLTVAESYGIQPPLRHIANSAGTLTRPDTHFDLVRPGIAVYGLSPVPGVDYGLRPAMTVRARVQLVKRVPEGQGVSYGHSYRTAGETTLAVIPVGYADGVPRAAGNSAQIQLAGANRAIAGRVCMDQVVLDCGDDPVREGDVAVLFGPGDDGEPTADDWAEAVGTINYEIVTRIGSVRAPRVYFGEREERAPASPAVANEDINSGVGP